MKKSLFISVAICSLGLSLHAQNIGSIQPVLIGSTGNFSVNGGIMLSSSTGECMVPTWGTPTLILTQGFQQPSTNGTLALNATVLAVNNSCAGSNDASASVSIYGGLAPYSVQWSTGDTTNRIDSLSPGTYSATVTDALGLTQTQTFTISDGSGICDLQLYSGLTVNGDGHNDTWIIGNLEAYPENSVSIYNRWGVEVWSGSHYDNSGVVFAGKDKSGSVLPDGTYYYVISVTDPISSAVKTANGWLELSH